MNIKFNNTEFIQKIGEGPASSDKPLNSLSGDGKNTQKVVTAINKFIGCRNSLLTPSCTAALEMAAILCNIEPGDEVIMPSNTFVSTANAFVLRGGVPVFVDCSSDTLNLDVSKLDEALSSKTKCIVPVHYAGISCEMDEISAFSSKNNLKIVEDAAQAIGSKYKGRLLGSIGDLATFSFHETKNILCGEGGAITINNEALLHRAEVIREKGTNRSSFSRGEVDKYSWVDIGSSYLLGELPAQFLLQQFEKINLINADRINSWNYYYSRFKSLEEKDFLRRPIVPDSCSHNGHMFYILLNEKLDRQQFLANLKKVGINAVSHYVPLHSSPAGQKFSRYCGDMAITNNIATSLVRLPLYFGINEQQLEFVVGSVEKVISSMIKNI